MELNHIGIVVKDISRFAQLLNKLGFSIVGPPQPYPIHKVVACFVTVCDRPPIRLELLEPTEEKSPVTNFLKKRGGGLHHLCFNVEDLEETTRRLELDGHKLVVPPVASVGYDRVFESQGVRGTKVAFLLTSERLLIELLQKEKPEQTEFDPLRLP